MPYERDRGPFGDTEPRACLAAILRGKQRVIRTVEDHAWIGAAQVSHVLGHKARYRADRLRVAHDLARGAREPRAHPRHAVGFTSVRGNKIGLACSAREN